MRDQTEPLWIAGCQLAVQDTEYVIPKDKAHVVERLHRFCAKCQSLEPQLPAYALATRLRVAFQGYVVELGLKVVEDRRAEVRNVGILRGVHCSVLG